MPVIYTIPHVSVCSRGAGSVIKGMFGKSRGAKSQKDTRGDQPSDLSDSCVPILLTTLLTYLKALEVPLSK